MMLMSNWSKSCSRESSERLCPPPQKDSLELYSSKLAPSRLLSQHFGRAKPLETFLKIPAHVKVPHISVRQNCGAECGCLYNVDFVRHSVHRNSGLMFKFVFIFISMFIFMLTFICYVYFAGVSVSDTLKHTHIHTHIHTHTHTHTHSHLHIDT